ncbi:hypothetical protein RNT41_04595 [Staphylococcus pseudintermedius]|uniref:hypothetical protein n=1 Tax=Staphylococcus pseudintermedius TaxID=283734 RepID=UPI00288844FF|nr:hypothetical protein [Staphylococcus pseudintermedius]MDT0939225.1 hypothetical protein [Staphylococcus pseudintermedius]
MFDFETFDFNKLRWYSDWNGDEVGYDDVDVVGYYSYHDLNLYIDTSTLNILEAWFDED